MHDFIISKMYTIILFLFDLKLKESELYHILIDLPVYKARISLLYRKKCFHLL